MFSVIIPLYNKAHTIERTLLSVLNQNYTDFEILIIDDGSTDNSVSVIENYTKDSRIRIIRQENQGVSVARNVGILEAKGEYIAFLDGDDEWLPAYLEKVRDTIMKFPNVGMILLGRYGQNAITQEKNYNIPRKYYNKTLIINFFHNPHVFSHISATTVRRDLLQNNMKTWGGFVKGQRSNEDFVFLFRIALSTTVAYCGIPLAIYNGNIENQATTTLNKQIKLNDSILFHNLVIQEWVNKKRKDKSFIVFMKYEIRHTILNYIKSDDYESLNYFIASLDVEYLKIFSKIELNLYRIKFLNKISKFYILFTKIIWRLNFYPVV